MTRKLEVTGVLLLLGSALGSEADGIGYVEEDAVQAVKLLAEDGEALDFFGESVSISDHTALIGARGDDDLGASSGAAYVFVRNGDRWLEEEKLLAEDGAPAQGFGWSVSNSGDSAVIGSIFATNNGSLTGAAYLFERERGRWEQEAKLLANDGEEFDHFGWSVSISDDTVVVGAPFESGEGSSSGAAYVFVRVRGRWSQQTKLVARDADMGDQFGYSVAVAGNTAVVGAPFEDERGTSSGAAYVFVRDRGRWSQQAKLLGSDEERLSFFGSSVSLSGETAVVGAIGNDVNASVRGAAYAFVGGGGDWSEQAKLVSSDGAEWDEFGESVAIDGDLILVGASEHDGIADASGAAYLFVRTGEDWFEQWKLLPAAGDADAFLGQAVAIAGETVVVGAPGDGEQGPGSGAAWVYDVEAIFTLEVAHTGTGSGIVESHPPGIDCGVVCSADYALGTVVDLEAIPTADSFFNGWSGDADCHDGEVVMLEDLNCSARFDLRTPRLSVLKTGLGSGRVTSTPAGIDCGTDCEQAFSYGTTVELTADPDPDSQFGGWSGDADCSDGEVVMAAERVCEARFLLTLIFRNGFESGDTSAWSSADP